MTDDRISYNTPDTSSGGDWEPGTVDEIVATGVTVHVEMLDDDCAYFHLTAATGRQIRGHFTAMPLTTAQRRDAAWQRGEKLAEVPKAALRITVEDDELDLSEGGAP